MTLDSLTSEWLTGIAKLPRVLHCLHGSLLRIGLPLICRVVVCKSSFVFIHKVSLFLCGHKQKF